MVLIREIPSSIWSYVSKSHTSSASGNGAEEKDKNSSGKSVDSFGAVKSEGENKCPLPDRAKEFALSMLTKKISPSVSISLPAGLTLALKAHEQPFLITDDRIKNDEIKMAYSKCLLDQRGVRCVVWFETGGALELGPGINGTVPITYFTNLNGGFNATGLLSYRQMQPVTIGNFCKTASSLKAFCPILPFSAKTACLLPPGSEFELTGQGKLALSGSVSVDMGAKICGLVSRVANASVGGNVNVTKTYQLSILSLGKNKVRVTLSDVSDSKMALLGNAAVGLDVSLPTILPDVGKGILQKIIENPVDGALEGFIDQYTQAKLEAEVSREDIHRKLCTFEMDLNEPRAAGAYENLFKLSPEEAITLSLEKDSGVKLVKVTESEDIDQESLNLQFFGSKLLLVKALDQDKKGIAKRTCGPKIQYREVGFKKELASWFTGQKNVLWETVAVENDDGPIEHYLRFFFTEKDYITRQKKIDWFFRFADLLDVERSSDIHASLPHMDKLSKIFSSADDTQAEVDIYFTKESLQEIKRSTKRSAFLAFSNAMTHLDPYYAEIPWHSKADPQIERAEALLLDVVRKNRSNYFSWLPIFDATLDYKHDYYKLCGRNLGKDIALYEQAEAFAQAIEKLKETSSLNAMEAWFATFGHKKGFDYMATIAALHTLSGKENCLVHRLNLHGGGVALESVDEGMLKPPSSFATDLLA